MLFVLAQKLLRWFMEERREQERLAQSLEEELLRALRTPPPVAQAVESASDCHRIEEQEDEHPLLDESQDRRQEMEMPPPPAADSKRAVDSETQTEEVEETPTDRQVTTTETIGVQTEADAATSTESTDASTQGGDLSSPKPDAVTQTDPVEAGVGETQTEPASHVDLLDRPVQTDHAEVIDTPAQTESATLGSAHQDTQTETVVADHYAQTETTLVAEVEVQASTAPVTTCDSETSMAYELTRTDSAVQTAGDEQFTSEDPTALTTRPTQDSIAVYLQVHTSIIRAQRIARGYVTRRRFYRMLNDLVYAKASVGTK